eukprot:tig00021531_g22163.t1
MAPDADLAAPSFRSAAPAQKQLRRSSGMDSVVSWGFHDLRLAGAFKIFITGSPTRGALAAGAAGAQRRPFSRLPDSRRPRGWGGRGAAAALLSLGSPTRGALAAGAAGAQRRPFSRLGARLAAPSRLGRPGRSGGPSLAWEPDSRRPRGWGGRGAAVALLSLEVWSCGAFTAATKIQLAASGLLKSYQRSRARAAARAYVYIPNSIR